MQRMSLLVCWILLSLSFTANASTTFALQFMDLVNAHRSSIGLRDLILDDRLSAIVTKHSQNIASGAVGFGHSNFSYRCTASKKVLGGGNWCGENVAKGQRTPQGVFNAWMNSAYHRGNLENVRATRTGFGYAKNAAGTYYWTEIFLEY